MDRNPLPNTQVILKIGQAFNYSFDDTVVKLNRDKWIGTHYLEINNKPC